VPAEDQTPVRVLVVDDSEVYRYALCAVVAATRGFEVVGTASSGREALDVASLLDPQLVLLDVHMPGLDGFQTARRFCHRHPDAVVLLLTASRPTSTTTAAAVQVVEDKGILSPQWLTDFWLRQGESR
jgi:DNA-binding NarL/FixJ family response regulator